MPIRKAKIGPPVVAVGGHVPPGLSAVVIVGGHAKLSVQKGVLVLINKHQAVGHVGTLDLSQLLEERDVVENEGIVLRIAIDRLAQVVAAGAQRPGRASAGVGKCRMVGRAMVDAKRTVVREQHPVLDVSRCGGGEAPGGACGDSASVAVRAAVLNGIVRHQQVIVVHGVAVPADFELFQIAEAGESPGPVFGAG